MNNKFEKYAQIRAEDAALVARMVDGRTREKVGKRTITHLTPDAWDAKAELVKKHTPFVVTIVDKHRDIGYIPFEDRLAYGLSGFEKSLDTVDKSNSSTLLRHSEPFIKASIIDSLRLDSDAITLKRDTWELLHKINKVSDKLSTKEHKATPAEIAQYIKKETPKSTISEERIRQTQQAAYINRTAPSNNQAYDIDTKTSLQFDQASKRDEPEYACIRMEEEERAHQLISDALDDLDFRSRDIITNRPPYRGEPNDRDVTLQVSADKWGISKEMIRKIEKKARTSMEQYLIENNVSEPE